MSRGKYWCWTLNNYTEEEEKYISEAVERNEDITYTCFGKETGQLGTPHLQGYTEFKHRIRLGAVKRIPGFGRMHLERRGGSAAQAKAYCEKDGDFYEQGTMSGSNQGKRTDLDDIRKGIDEGKTSREIAEEHFGSWCRYRKSFDAYRMLAQSKKTRDIKVYTLSGAPGVGKTRWVFEREGDDLWIASDPTCTWFDGYNGEKAVLLDDYDGKAEARFFLRLLDRYPVSVPVKGGYVPWIPERLYITSNSSCPFGMFAIEEPLRRRISLNIEVKKPLYSDEESGTDFEEGRVSNPRVFTLPSGNPDHAIKVYSLDELERLFE